jgi:hypothetical protein
MNGFTVSLLETTSQPVHPVHQPLAEFHFRKADVIVVVLNRDTNADDGSNLNTFKNFVKISQESAKPDVDYIAVLAATDTIDERSITNPTFEYCRENDIPYVFVEMNEGAINYMSYVEGLIRDCISNKKHGKNDGRIVHLTDGNEPSEKKCCS